MKAPPLLHIVTLLIAAAAIVGPGWAVFLYTPSLAGTVPEAAILARFDAMAEDACKCARGNGTEAGVAPCWEAFDKTAAPYAPVNSVLACGMVGSDRLCFGDATPEEHCIVVDRSPDGFCNAEERRVITALLEPLERDDLTDAERARAERALASAREAFKRGDAIAPPGQAAAGGCGG